MPNWLKIALIILVVMVGLAFSAGFFLVRWFKSYTGDMQAEIRKGSAEGTAFGRGRDPDACVDETFARLKRCGGMMCEMNARFFLVKCTESSNVPADFCRPVPKVNEFIATSRWAARECARHGRSGDQQCMRVINALQVYCESR